MVSSDMGLTTFGLLRNSILEIVFLPVRIILIMKDYGLATQDATFKFKEQLSFEYKTITYLLPTAAEILSKLKHNS